MENPVATTELTPQLEQQIHTLAGIWRKVLRIPEVGSEDNFFELGGNSALLVVAVTLAKRAGVNLPLKRAFERQTLRGMAEAATQPEEDELAPVREVVLSRRPAARRAYVILTSGEDLPIVNRLAVRIANLDVALHVLMPQWHESEPYRSPASLVPFFVERMLSSHAPVVIGHCAAGTLAARIAVQLQEAGKPVRRLILLDTLTPGEHHRGWALEDEIPTDPEAPHRLAEVRAELARIAEDRKTKALPPQEAMRRAWQAMQPELVDLLSFVLDAEAATFADEDTRREAARNFMAWFDLIIGMEEPLERHVAPDTETTLFVSDAGFTEEILQRYVSNWQAVLGGTIALVVELGGHRALLTNDRLVDLIAREEL